MDTEEFALRNMFVTTQNDRKRRAALGWVVVAVGLLIGVWLVVQDLNRWVRLLVTVPLTAGISLLHMAWEGQSIGLITSGHWNPDGKGRRPLPASLRDTLEPALVDGLMRSFTQAAVWAICISCIFVSLPIGVDEGKLVIRF
eukprot:GGOE01022299.1.p1 GENE.GGOE01022299.1~~GGOE01022299.1.p1  ORF type:complete len:167 (-),score=45.16 GGOE01022299.1:535-960(-)